MSLMNFLGLGRQQPTGVPDPRRFAPPANAANANYPSGGLLGERRSASSFPFQHSNRNKDGTWEAPLADRDNILRTSVDPYEPVWPRWKKTPPLHHEGDFVSDDPFFDIDEISGKVELYPPGRPLRDGNVDGNPARRQRVDDLPAGNSWRRRLLVGEGGEIPASLTGRVRSRLPNDGQASAVKNVEPFGLLSAATLDSYTGAPDVSQLAFQPQEQRGKVIPVISQFESRFIPDSVVQRFKGTAKTLVQSISNNAFTQEQLDRIADEIYRNIPLLEATRLGSINPNQRPLLLNSEQYRIVQEQLSKLTPELREAAPEQFNRAVQSGDIRCSNCGPPRR